MLPFLAKTKEGSVSAPVEVQKREPDEEQDYDSLESAVEDLFAAFKANDVKAGCAAFRAAFDLLESQPHEEAGE